MSFLSIRSDTFDINVLLHLLELNINQYETIYLKGVQDEKQNLQQVRQPLDIEVLMKALSIVSLVNNKPLNIHVNALVGFILRDSYK